MWIGSKVRITKSASPQQLGLIGTVISLTKDSKGELLYTVLTEPQNWEFSLPEDHLADVTPVDATEQVATLTAQNSHLVGTLQAHAKSVFEAWHDYSNAAIDDPEFDKKKAALEAAITDFYTKVNE
jgi:hypothetical protein